MEDLKARYYEVASRMMAVQKPVQYMTQPEFALHELMAHFNPQQEKLRKDFALNSFGRSREEAREEESLLLEIKRILARSDRFNEERRELYNRLDYPHAEQDINTFKSSAGLQTLLQNLMTADKSKKRKSIMGAEVPTPSGQPTPQQAAPENGRRDSAAASSGPRESGASTAASSAHKKSQSQSQQQIQQQQAQQQQQQSNRNNNSCKSARNLPSTRRLSTVSRIMIAWAPGLLSGQRRSTSCSLINPTSSSCVSPTPSTSWMFLPSCLCLQQRQRMPLNSSWHL
jgi:DNA methyltransferase 1-associated protein 1